VGERRVRCDDQGAGLVGVGDELEQEPGRVAVDGDVAELVELCRHRHSSTYADLGIMPTWLVSVTVSPCQEGLEGHCLLGRST
jgi:hypothetical protein